MEEVSTHTSSHTRRSSIEGGYEEVQRAEDDEEFNTPRDPFDENGSVSIHPIIRACCLPCRKTFILALCLAFTLLH